LDGLPADEEVREATDDADREGGADQLRRPERGEAEEGVEGVDAGAREGDASRAGGVEQWELDAIGGGEESMLPVHGARGDDHDGEHERGPDGAEEAEGEEESAGELAGGGGEGEEAAGGEAELDEKLTCGVEAVAAEPAEELLGAVAGPDESEDQPADEESGADHARVEGVGRVHIVSSPGALVGDQRGPRVGRVPNRALVTEAAQVTFRN
jgi:hypothetical protein